MEWSRVVVWKAQGIGCHGSSIQNPKSTPSPKENEKQKRNSKPKAPSHE